MPGARGHRRQVLRDLPAPSVFSASTSERSREARAVQSRRLVGRGHDHGPDEVVVGDGARRSRASLDHLIGAATGPSWGMANPRVFAVLRLITSSNFVGCSTGKSAGFAPFTYLIDHDGATRR